jgi:hypothetical protein
MRRLAIISATVVAICAAAGVASAHTLTPGGSWYFDGMTYDADDRTERIDPVNFIFAPGPLDNTLYDRDRVEQHLNDDWDHHEVGGSGWRTDSGIRSFCKDDQRMFWENVTARTSDKTDWHGSTAQHGGICGRQHHARFWDDQEHARQTGNHGPEDQWAVGGIHYERVIDREGELPKHKIARDWDIVRHQLIRAMHEHCSDAAWRYHPDADSGEGRKTQGYNNLGFIARLSLRHVASPGSCEGW